MGSLLTSSLTTLDKKGGALAGVIMFCIRGWGCCGVRYCWLNVVEGVHLEGLEGCCCRKPLWGEVAVGCLGGCADDMGGEFIMRFNRSLDLYRLVQSELFLHRVPQQSSICFGIC